MRSVTFLFGLLAYWNAFGAVVWLGVAFWTAFGVGPDTVMEFAQNAAWVSDSMRSDIQRAAGSGALGWWILVASAVCLAAALQAAVSTGAWAKLQRVAGEWRAKRRVTPILIQHLQRSTFWLGVGSLLSLVYLGVDSFFGLSRKVGELLSWAVRNNPRPSEAMDFLIAVFNESNAYGELLLEPINQLVTLSGTMVIFVWIISFVCTKWAQHWLELERRQESLEAENALIV